MGTTPTSVDINGVRYELKNMSTADGAKLYDALGVTGTKTNYQALADNYTKLIMDLQSVVPMSELPPGVGPQEGLGKLYQAMAQLKAGTIKALDPSMQALKDKFEALDIVKKARNVEAVGDLPGPMDVLMMPWHFASDYWDGAKTGLKATRMYLDTREVSSKELEAIEQAKKHPVTAEQAKAMAAAIVATIYNQTDGPAAPPAAAPGMIDTGLAKAEAMTQGFWGTTVGKWLTTIGHFISNGFGGKGWSWGAATQEAEAIALTAQNAPQKTPEQILEENRLAKIEPEARGLAIKMLADAGQVAGLSTINIAQSMDKPCVYLAKDGAWKTLEFKSGTPEVDVLKDEQGNPLTHEQRDATRWNKLEDELKPKSIGGALGEMTTALPGVAVGAGGYAASKLPDGTLTTLALSMIPGIGTIVGPAYGAMKAADALSDKDKEAIAAKAKKEAEAKTKANKPTAAVTTPATTTAAAGALGQPDPGFVAILTTPNAAKAQQQALTVNAAMASVQSSQIGAVGINPTAPLPVIDTRAPAAASLSA